MTTRWKIGRRAGWRWSGATAEEMQISRWPAADQILLVPGGEDSAVQLDYLVNRYILHSAH